MRPRVLLIADEPGWAFDRNLRDLAAHLGGEFDFDFWYCVRQGAPPTSGYDACYAAYRWDLGETFPYRRAVGSLRCQHFNPARPGPPARADAEAAARWGAFHTVTRRTCEQLAVLWPAAGGAPDRLAYLTNPVDAARLAHVHPPRDRVVASWSGNALHCNARGLRVKGFFEIVRPACHAAGVPLAFAEYRLRRVAPEAMPAFYAEGNVTVCASLYEGASNSVMEAMAAGHAVVSTDCGNIREMLDSAREHLGDSGIVIVERDVAALAGALSALTPARAAEMGQINRAEIAARWSWPAWRDRYAALLHAALTAPAAAR